MKLLKLAFEFLYYRGMAYALSRAGKGVHLAYKVNPEDELKAVMELIETGKFEDHIKGYHPSFYNQVKTEYQDVFIELKQLKQ